MTVGERPTRKWCSSRPARSQLPDEVRSRRSGAIGPAAPDATSRRAVRGRPRRFGTRGFAVRRSAVRTPGPPRSSRSGRIEGTDPPEVSPVDPLAGGVAIIAAEKLGRACYAMEIDPTYV